MKIDEQVKYTDTKSQYKDHNTGVPGFNDALEDIFSYNIHKERPRMDKWEELKSLVEAELSWPHHYSHERPVEKNVMHRVKRWMEDLEKREKDEGFLFTGIPTFDQKAWERILEERGLQGLA